MTRAASSSMTRPPTNLRASSSTRRPAKRGTSPGAGGLQPRSRQAPPFLSSHPPVVCRPLSGGVILGVWGCLAHWVSALSASPVPFPVLFPFSLPHHSSSTSSPSSSSFFRAHRGRPPRDRRRRRGPRRPAPAARRAAGTRKTRRPSWPPRSQPPWPTRRCPFLLCFALL